MKKFLSLLLALTMAMAMSVTAFAADPTTDVKGTYEGSGSAPVYSYTYSWDTPVFTYKMTDGRVWNPETHTYSGEAGEAKGVWSVTNDTVTVTNHSNAAVKARLTYEAKAGYEDIKIGYDNNNCTIASAEGTTVENAPSANIRIGIATSNTGVLTEDDVNVVIGTLTLTVTGA